MADRYGLDALKQGTAMGVIKLEQVRFTGRQRKPGATSNSTGATADFADATDATAAPVGSAAATISQLTAELNALRADLRSRDASDEQHQHSAASALAHERTRLQAEAAAAVADARAEGYAAGLVDGRLQAVGDGARQLEALRTAAAQAVDRATASAAEIEALALGVARLALRAVLDDETWRAEALAASVRSHVRNLGSAAADSLRVQLSAADSGLVDALRAGLPQAEVAIDPALPAGACLVQLQGSSTDLGWAQQLTRLDELLASQAGHG
jgi:flagellar assembly protein FliH